MNAGRMKDLRMHPILIFLLVGVVSQAESKTPTFRSDAAEYMEAGFKTLRRRGGSQKDFTRIEISAKPLQMVEDPANIDTHRVSVELKTGDGMWTVIDGMPSMRGGVYKWVEVGVEPCKDHRVRIWVHGENAGQAAFELPTVVPAATGAELGAAQYTPGRPELLAVARVQEDSVVVSWAASSCAELYDVTYEALSGGEESRSQQVEGGQVTLTGLQSCSEYELRVTAILGQEYSEEAAVTFSTSPGFYAAEKLAPVITTTTNSVAARWKAFEKLSCVKKYSVAICKEGSACPEGTEVLRDDAMSELKFLSDATLDQCSDYSLQIKPIFGGEFLDERTLPFRTKSQPVADVAELLTSVEAEAGDQQMITVRWNAIQCASQYEVFQKVNTVDGEWEKIGTARDNVFESKGVPCTEYKYGVKVTIDDQVSEVVEFNEAIMTKIDTSVPYVAANLAITPTPDGAHLTWDHGKCIKSYKIRSCEILSESENCFEEFVIIEDPSMYKMAHTLKNLNSCSKHYLSIFPSMDGDTELDAAPQPFQTGSPPASPPQEVTVRLNRETNKVDIGWSRVQCAAGYRIHQTLGNSDTETKWDSDGLSVSLESPEPCVTYSYGVSAIVAGQESRPTALQEVPVPPRKSEQPVLLVEEKSNGSITFVINSAHTNRLCKVSQYHVKYNDKDQTLDAARLENGKITVEMPDDDSTIEGRVLYEDFSIWSPWVSSDSPRQEALGAEKNILLLIVIGALVACALPVILVVTVIVRQKKSQRKYDAEKAQGNTDEAKRLNDQTEEKVISS